MNKGISPPSGRGRRADQANVPFLIIGAAGEGRHCRDLNKCLPSPSAPLRKGDSFLVAQPPLPEGGDIALFMFGKPDSTYAVVRVLLA